ncbi:hypothetical protein F2Q69_00057379 [Brassica cretica]|uniref:Uncharacterized protein n=1 Tax=Brassica cretica TaxID=69181 RepID=A0A8S9N9K0_BRACR|nr:hypothetical protein F2Q69_00057379 [Brassica cretica]
MDHCVCKQVQPVARKAKKKKKAHGKDEFDRVEQAEKKKRRLEKALATSAAIRAELEKKKLEEQQRLDEEGAAIAEAVALHVLLGEASEDDSSPVMLGGEESFEMDMFRGDSNWSPFAIDVWDDNMGLSADLIAAQAVSSLQISENTDGNAFVFNGMFRG